MKTKFLSLVLTLSTFFAFGPALAAPNKVPATVLPSGQHVVVPERAIEVAPHVFSLGTASDPQSGDVVEGYAIVHYRQAPEKGGRGNGGGKPDKGGKGGSSCYGYLAKGAKWKEVEAWVVNASNIRGLDEAFVLANLSMNIEKWEDAADGVLGNGTSVEILGDGSGTSDLLVADSASPDGLNEVYFADISDAGAIGVTIVWGIFGGPPSGRKLVEWDQIYDDVDYDWSATGEASKMDFESIATHELGHSIGLGDLYDASCSTETMYGYASEGETEKRTLETGDIIGTDRLY